jgi:FkbM family methyltransferase
MTLTSSINQILRRKFKIEIHKTLIDFEETRYKLLLNSSVTLLIDGGANEGQYASRVRKSGYSGSILSIEPYSVAFEKLKSLSQHDDKHKVLNCALGSSKREAKLHLSSNSGMSSSLYLPMKHLEFFPTVKFEADEIVNVVTLDELVEGQNEKVFLKLDVQGSELEILESITACLPMIVAMEIEITLQPMYEGESTIGKILTQIESMGFYVFTINQFAKDENGQVTYFDLIVKKLS